MRSSEVEPKGVVLVGGGGHCRACIDVIEQTQQWRIGAILDVRQRVGQSVQGYDVVGTDEEIPHYVAEGFFFLIAVGQIKNAATRLRLFDAVVSAGGTLASVVSPYAYVSPHAKVGVGTIVMHNAIVNVGACVGANVIINSGALIEHDARIGDHCHVSTKAVVNGSVVVGRETFIGSGAILHQGAAVPDNAIIPAGHVFHSKR
jgi:sugar O-acyltransferase (sialic acid O-acetyltransferase NeuD family)